MIARQLEELGRLIYLKGVTILVHKIFLKEGKWCCDLEKD